MLSTSSNSWATGKSCPNSQGTMERMICWKKEDRGLKCLSQEKRWRIINRLFQSLLCEASNYDGSRSTHFFTVSSISFHFTIGRNLNAIFSCFFPPWSRKNWIYALTPLCSRHPLLWQLEPWDEGAWPSEESLSSTCEAFSVPQDPIKQASKQQQQQ